MEHGLIIILGLVGFVFLIISIFAKERMAKVVTLLVSFIIFAALGAANTYVEYPQCSDLIVNSTTINNTDFYSYERDCFINHHFDNGGTWFFSGLSILPLILAIVVMVTSPDDLNKR